ncbi:SRPBCC family protein [Inquilinus limosus]|uniref:SRPBCC family protein n=1 Tax=Inquilinus limosus TaxID=171674 RepID=UPI000402536B|nr:SRPBCC family protein [Inquilinus limosus]
MDDTTVFRREIRVPAPPATIFAFLTDPQQILRWMGRTATLEPQPGGLYLLDVDGINIVRGAFREVVPVHRLVYSFGWEGNAEVPPGSSLIEIDLIEQPDGTLMRMTHSGLPPSAVPAHARGWMHYLERLAAVVAGGDPGPDPLPPCDHRES